MNIRVTGLKRASSGAKRMAGEMRMPLNAPGAKAFKEVKVGDRVVDYVDVTIRGYLSTFEGATPSDRQGDAVLKGAFLATIPRFQQNPVLLIDHRNQSDHCVGSFTVIKEDDRGLYVEATLSNSPTPAMTEVRYKVAEGHLRSLSMGGLFHYADGGNKIFRVDLWEGSLVPIPANPDALITTRSLTLEEERELGLNTEAETRPE